MNLLRAFRNLAIASLLAFAGSPALAQNYQTIRITSSEAEPKQLNMDGNEVTLSVSSPGSVGAQWAVEPIAGTNRVYLRNARTQAYLGAIRLLNSTTARFAYGGSFPGTNPGNNRDYQWVLSLGIRGTDIFSVQGENGSLLHIESIDGSNRVVLNTSKDWRTGPFSGSYAWHVENYTPPVYKRFFVGQTAIYDGSIIALSTDGIRVGLLPIDNHPALTGVIPGNATTAGHLINAPEDTFKVEIVNADQHLVRLSPTRASYRGMVIGRMSYWSGLPGFTDFSYYMVSPRNADGAYQIFKMEESGNAILLSEEGAYLSRFCCVASPSPSDTVYNNENIMVSRFSNKTGSRGLFNVYVVGP